MFSHTRGRRGKVQAGGLVVNGVMRDRDETPDAAPPFALVRASPRAARFPVQLLEYEDARLLIDNTALFEALAVQSVVPQPSCLRVR